MNVIEKHQTIRELIDVLSDLNPDATLYVSVRKREGAVYIEANARTLVLPLPLQAFRKVTDP